MKNVALKFCKLINIYRWDSKNKLMILSNYCWINRQSLSNINLKTTILNQPVAQLLQTHKWCQLHTKVLTIILKTLIPKIKIIPRITTMEEKTTIQKGMIITLILWKTINLETTKEKTQLIIIRIGPLKTVINMIDE